MNSNNSYTLKTGLLMLALMAPLAVMAQQSAGNGHTLRLSLEEATELALDQNFSIEQAGYEVDKTQAKFRQTNAVFLPQLSFEYNAISTDDPLNVFGFKLKQEVVSQQDFNPALLNDPDAYENYSAKFEVRQPLLNPDMFLQRGAVKSKLQSSREQLAGTKNYIRFQVRQQYYNLILHLRQLEVLDAALETAQAHRRQAQNYFEQGMISKEDFLAAKVYELEMESRQLHTQNERDKVEEELALLLGLEGNAIITPTDELQVEAQPELADNLSEIEINNAQTRAIDLQVEAAQKMVKSAGFSFLPKINAFGSYEYNDQDFAGFDASSYMIGLNLRWDLFSGFSKAGKVMEAKADYHKAQSMQESHRQEQQNRLRQALRSLDHAQKELALTEEAITQSTEDVTIRTNRYEEGMERTTDLLEAETKLAEAKLKRVMARFKYNMSLAALELLLEEHFKN
ncbi:TolC family protein [Gracilimonas mengyeensis]|uniref:Outer membrane protein TolC n=1 Tax=Gracilimonas mengyeensis TaxID=1302730 RepID=A0A521FLZ6_9BACT|nr:TolC family protein [Gracilimonas mengyeensis]SMO97146.1 Outer membrane protein TolC [Gracilimonas mengyeensis]